MLQNNMSTRGKILMEKNASFSLFFIYVIKTPLQKREEKKIFPAL
jgi:hypothetical protein